MLRTGKTTSVGNGFLSRFKVTIDWKNKNLHLLEIAKTTRSIHFSGFSLGYSVNQGVYVQSVIENSNAYNKGVRPNMKVLRIDGLNFERGNDFCDYVNHKLEDEIFLQLIDNVHPDFSLKSFALRLSRVGKFAYFDQIQNLVLDL